jgi:hypothetical protein
MRWLVLLALAGCPDKPAKPQQQKKTTVIVPPGAKLLVAKDCNTWPHPPSKYFFQDIVTVDLDAGTVVHTRVEGEEDAVPPPETKRTEEKLAADRATLIRARLDDVLHGGPYEQKYPPSGGSRCTLVLHGGDIRKPYLSIDRAEKVNDAIDKLMDAL